MRTYNTRIYFDNVLRQWIATPILRVYQCPSAPGIPHLMGYSKSYRAALPKLNPKGMCEAPHSTVVYQAPYHPLH